MRRLTDTELTEDTATRDGGDADEESPAEIGLRLALADGVSAGVAAIGGELAALRRAVVSGGVELARLQALGVAAQAVNGAAPPVVVEAAVPAPEGRAEAATMPPAPVAHARADLSAVAATVSAGAMPPMTDQRLAAAGVAPMAAPMSVTGPADVAAVASTAAAAEQASVAAVAAVAPVAAVAAMAPGGLPGVDGATGAAGRPGLSAPSLSAFAPAAVAMPAMTVVQPDGWRVDGMDTAEPAVVPAMRDMPATPAETAVSLGMDRAVAAPVPDGVMAMAGPSFAPVAPRQEPARAAAMAAEPATARPDRGEAREAASGPTGGDVILDGVRMGRWIATTLARAAAQPQSGSTMHDPRMGPVFPGSLQGG